MEVAELTARIEAEVGGFLRNLQAADREIARTQGMLDDLARSSILSSEALEKVKITATQTAETRARLESMTRDLHELRRTAIETEIALLTVGRGGGRGGFGDGGGGGGGGAGGRGPLHGILPGGARAGAGGLALLAALGISAAPELLAAAGGVGLAAASLPGIGLGAMGAYRLAGVSDVFKGTTDLKTYQSLTTQQKSIADLLRSVEGGLGAQLHGIAQQGVLPGIQAGITSALTPNTVHMLTQATQQFSQAVGQAAHSWGQFFGSTEFSSQFGRYMQRNAGYLKDFSHNLQGLVDVGLRVSNGTSGVVDYLDKVSTAAIKHAQAWAQSARGQREMGQFSQLAIRGLQDVGHLLLSIGEALKGLFDVFGTLSVINLLTRAFQVLAGFLNQNKDALKNFFSGLQQSLNDVFTVFAKLEYVIRPILRAIDAVARALGGWRPILDAIFLFLSVRMVAGWIAARTAATAAASETEAALAPLLAELEAINLALATMGAAATTSAAEVGAATGTMDAELATVTGAAQTARFSIASIGSAAAGAAAALGPLAAIFATIAGYQMLTGPNISRHSKAYDLAHDINPLTGKQGFLGQLVSGIGHATGLYDFGGSASTYGISPQALLSYLTNPNMYFSKQANGTVVVYDRKTGKVQGNIKPGEQNYSQAAQRADMHQAAQARAATGQPPPLNMNLFSGGLTNAQQQAISRAEIAQAQARTPAQQAAATANLRSVYQGILATVQAHQAGLHGAALTANLQEQAQLNQMIQTYGPLTPFETGLGPKGRKPAFDPLTLAQHQAISQGIQALAQAQTSGDVAAQLKAAQDLQATYQHILTAVRAEHETGRNRVRQLAEEATLARDVARTHREILSLIKQQNAATLVTGLGSGPYLTSPNAQIALQYGYKPSAHDYLIDIKMQANAAAQEQRDLQRLANRGASTGLIQSLRGEGATGAAIAHALQGASASTLHAYEQVFARRQQQTRVATMTVHAQTVNINARGIRQHNTAGSPSSRLAAKADRFRANLHLQRRV